MLFYSCPEPQDLQNGYVLCKEEYNILFYVCIAAKIKLIKT